MPQEPKKCKGCPAESFNALTLKEDAGFKEPKHATRLRCGVHLDRFLACIEIVKIACYGYLRYRKHSVHVFSAP
ncbi:hypothetical protein Y032_0002g556 [Ancylostoma ceylanicum]|uniref:Uncharacterized protein n=1 Tax=Ancylostoma ceylanicum TaxID=53326 RepID=A0A016W214_9BILA|nr:hypothetical protein Y032_0002g556 [Ancylostoma ceylanicum]